MEPKVYKYVAFISYQRNDEETAKWLHHHLEHYKLPVNICEARPELPKELRPLFLDDAELSGGNLSKVIHQALNDSKHLIVLCSPDSAKSPWVNEEVQTFIESGRTERIIPMIIDGIPYSKDADSECFPKALISLRKTKHERLGISMKGGQEIASVKLIAQLLGVSFDELWQRYEREKEEERQRLIREKRRLQRLESRFLTEKAEGAIQKDDSYLACMIALRALPADLSDPEDRPYIPEAEAILRQAASLRTARLKGHKKGVASISLSPNGKYLVSSSSDGTVIIWDLDSGAKIQTITDHSDQVNSACFSNDGSHILSASSDGTVKITDLKSGKTLRTLDNCCVATCAVYSHCGNFIASGSNDGSICIWDVETGNLLSELIGHDEWVSSVRFSKCGKHILSASEDGTVKLWSISEESCIRTFDKHSGHPVNSAEFSQDENTILSSSDDKTIKAWNADTGKVLYTLAGHENIVSHAEYSPDYNMIISSSWDNTVKIWDANTGRLIRTHQGHSLAVSSAKFSHDGSFIISGSWDNTINLWSPTPNIEKRILNDGNELASINCLAFCIDSKHFLASSDNDIKLWDIESGNALRTFSGHTDKVRHIAISPDGKRFASGSEDGTIRLWNMNDPEAILTLTGHCKTVHYVAFSPDGKLLMSASMDHSAKIWNICEASATNIIPRSSDIVYKALYDSEHHEFIATTSKEAFIREAEGFTFKKRLTIHSDNINNPIICHLNNHKLLLCSGTGDGSMGVWDMDKETDVWSFSNKHNADIHFAVFINDGKQILSSAVDGSIKIINAENGEDIWSFTSQYGNMRHLSLSPDGTLLAGACTDGKIYIYTYKNLQALINETRERFHNRELDEETKKQLYIE